MMFEFATAQRIIVGRGKIEMLGEIAAGFGTRALLVAGQHVQSAGGLERIVGLLGKRSIHVETLLAHGEPQVSTVDDGAVRARETGCQLCISVGGGSVMDLGKGAAGLATNGGSVMEYLEGVGTGRVLEHAPLPHIAIPTTAGTGSEVTRNAVITSKQQGFKKSFRSPMLIPTVALVDGSMTDGVPPEQTAATGLDALTQVMEPYVSSRAMPVTDALALEGVKRASRALPAVYRNGGDRDARDEMALVALLGGLCLANAGLGAVHGIAAALGARYEIAHGHACACVLWQTMEANIRALEQREPHSPKLRKYATLGEVLTGRTWTREAEARSALVETLRTLVGELGVPPLRRFGVEDAHVSALVAQSRGSSMQSNPIVLTDEEIGAVLRAAV